MSNLVSISGKQSGKKKQKLNGCEIWLKQWIIQKISILKINILKIGDIIIKDLFNTKVNVIATKNIIKK